MTSASIDEPRLVGGHVALDLVNTVAPRLPGSTRHVDYLDTPRDLLAWARRVRLVAGPCLDRASPGKCYFARQMLPGRDRLGRGLALAHGRAWQDAKPPPRAPARPAAVPALAGGPTRRQNWTRAGSSSKLVTLGVN